MKLTHHDEQAWNDMQIDLAQQSLLLGSLLFVVKELT